MKELQWWQFSPDGGTNWAVEYRGEELIFRDVLTDETVSILNINKDAIKDIIIAFKNVKG